MTSAEKVRDVLTSITGAPFSITEPGPHRLLLRQNSVWFVANLDLAYLDRTAYLDRAWEDRQGALWLETSEIADMIALVEREYGEKGAAEMPDVKPGVTPSGGIPDEVTGYPRVVSLLREYDRIATEVGTRNGVELKLLYDGGVGVTTVRIGGRVPAVPSSGEAMKETVESVAKALREAYERVVSAEANGPD